MKRIALTILMICFSSLSLLARRSLKEAPTEEKRGPDRLFMPKGDFSGGAQFFYVDLSSNDSEYLMLLEHLDANGTIMTFSPYLDYSYKNNRSVGVRAKYSSAKGGISNADSPMLSDDLAVSLNDILADSRTVQAEVIHTEPMPLWTRVAASESSPMSLWDIRYTSTSFSYNEAEPRTIYAIANRVKIAVHPGLMVFVTNSISTHVAIGIGGSYLQPHRLLQERRGCGHEGFLQSAFHP